MKTDPVVSLVERLKEKGLSLATAESCTGGLLGKRITDVSGASAVYPGGVVSYSNAVKAKLLGVCEDDLRAFGAVSEPVARQMAEGVRNSIGADLGVGITGIAGPKSDDTKKPVGLVYIAASKGESTLCTEFHFSGDRAEIRQQSTDEAARLVLKLIEM